MSSVAVDVVFMLASVMTVSISFFSSTLMGILSDSASIFAVVFAKDVSKSRNASRMSFKHLENLSENHKLDCSKLTFLGLLPYSVAV
ncbi:hypothetical protein BCR33DRAFT_14562 [Rhizoclosmatium globosum]|uniref:Uncharacterized protein n=1 Tax=Rhizoclosmatium globosum TaxID=329046 RepID=A0A1Y2CQ29_9FUNG|nr:hypothetical protein BCR33DRAFT_14562 [Rhizoclosmatium globosum]|eukprot:ORY48944.1 hypothetical protein BCR33DRAFT_14562 [Rhizoclosmatium globosum]